MERLVEFLYNLCDTVPITEIQRIVNNLETEFTEDQGLVVKSTIFQPPNSDLGELVRKMANQIKTG